jgi:multimeric flavodoxin WrbA
MKTLILDGSHSDDATSERVLASLQINLKVRGWETQSVTLRDKKIGVCAGDFYCWMRSPGVCNTDDDNRVIAEQVMQSDLVILLTPVTFGGFSSQLKRIMDHLIQNISPYFATINGETHHQKRYERYPDLLVVGWADEPNTQTESIFRHLVHRMSINMNAVTTVCGLVTGTQLEAELTAQTELWLEAIARASSSPIPALPTETFSSAEATPIQRAVLLVGSPRTKKSTSASLGGYLFEQLAERGIQTETIQLYTSINSPQRTKSMLAAIDGADLVVLAFPLYVDTLPAPVISALEKIAEHRKLNHTPTRFAAISNCGFSEAKHTETALAICAEFARQNGFSWMGSLALGGGQGLVGGTPLKDLDGRAIPIKQALEISATTLANGQPIPQSARDILARPIIPNWLYKMFGGFGWKQAAKQYGVKKQLRAKPYQKNKETQRR